jgi:hypothetical protein
LRTWVAGELDPAIKVKQTEGLGIKGEKGAKTVEKISSLFRLLRVALSVHQQLHYFKGGDEGKSFLAVCVAYKEFIYFFRSPTFVSKTCPSNFCLISKAFQFGWPPFSFVKS